MIRYISLTLQTYRCTVCRGPFKNDVYHKVTSSTVWEVQANDNICDDCLEKYNGKTS